jgi:hypothetical protein
MLLVVMQMPWTTPEHVRIMGWRILNHYLTINLEERLNKMMEKLN